MRMVDRLPGSTAAIHPDIESSDRAVDVDDLGPERVEELIDSAHLRLKKIEERCCVSLRKYQAVQGSYGISVADSHGERVRCDDAILRQLAEDASRLCCMASFSDLTKVRVVTSALVRIAPVTQRLQICQIIVPAVLSWGNVIDLYCSFVG